MEFATRTVPLAAQHSVGKSVRLFFCRLSDLVFEFHFDFFNTLHAQKVGTPWLHCHPKTMSKLRAGELALDDARTGLQLPCDQHFIVSNHREPKIVYKLVCPRLEVQ